MGMAHRGRLTVLANIIGNFSERIFTAFEGRCTRTSLRTKETSSIIRERVASARLETKRFS